MKFLGRVRASWDRLAEVGLRESLVAVLRHECAGQWLSASELLEKLHRRASERDVVDCLVSDPRRFEAIGRGVANAQGWVEWEYSARQ